MCRAASYGAAAVTAEARQALDGLDEVAPLDEVAKRLDGEVSPALLALAKALVVQAGGLGAVTPDRGGVRRVREAVRADREGLGPSRQLLGGAAVFARPRSCLLGTRFARGRRRASDRWRVLLPGDPEGVWRAMVLR